MLEPYLWILYSIAALCPPKTLDALDWPSLPREWPRTMPADGEVARRITIAAAACSCCCIKVLLLLQVNVLLLHASAAADRCCC